MHIFFPQDSIVGAVKLKKKQVSFRAGSFTFWIGQINQILAESQFSKYLFNFLWVKKGEISIFYQFIFFFFINDLFIGIC